MNYGETHLAYIGGKKKKRRRNKAGADAEAKLSQSWLCRNAPQIVLHLYWEEPAVLGQELCCEELRELTWYNENMAKPEARALWCLRTYYCWF